jgi:hypothetical protein
VGNVEYLLDGPQVDDLIESFPVFLVSDRLASHLLSSDLSGFTLEVARVRPSHEYLAVYGEAAHPSFMRLRVVGDEGADMWLDSNQSLCVSDGFMAAIRGFDLSRCKATPL